MTRRTWSVLLLMGLALSMVSAQEIPDVSADQIATIDVGTERGQLGRRIEEGNPFGNEPGRVEVSPDGLLYINDRANSRMNVYDADGQFLRNIDLSSTWEIRQANEYLITSKGLIVLPNFAFLGEVDGAGKVVYQMEIGSISESVKNSSAVWVFDDYVVFYDNDGNPRAIDSKGELLSASDTRPIVLKMREGSTIRANPELKAYVDEFLDSRKLMLLGDRLLGTDIRKHEAYWKVLWDRGKSLSLRHRVEDWDYDSSGGVLVGTDRNDDSYWYINNPRMGERDVLYVFSKYGEVLRALRVTPMVDAVAPNGDLYGINLKFQPNAQYAVFRLDHDRALPGIVTAAKAPFTRSAEIIELAQKGLGVTPDPKDLQLIASLSMQDLRILRNALFALHGYTFKSADLDSYFRQFDWYRPSSTVAADESVLTEAQRRLLKKVQEVESGG